MNLNARQMAKNLLNGELPTRPLVLPIVFSLGAKVENVPLSAFLNNPTKIASAALQMRNHLRADGVTCYFDPYLEVEALGATLQRRADDQPPAVDWKHSARAGQLPEGLRSPEEAAQSGRIPVAAEVIRRMNAVANRDFLLMASVSGPVALAALLTQKKEQEESAFGEFSAEALELAESVVTQVVTTFLEAGADSIFIHEQIPAGLSAKGCDEWASLLAPAINVARFYEALPVLQLADAPAVLESWEIILQHSWESVLCISSSVLLSRAPVGSSGTRLIPFGIALPVDLFPADNPSRDENFSNLHEAATTCKTAIISTAGDVPIKTDMRHLKKVFEEIPRG